MNLFGWLSLFLICSQALFAEDQWKSTRVRQLLGPLDTPLAVEPAIPDNFVALGPKGKLDLSDWVYWGPREVLESYFENPRSLTQAILRVKLSEIIKQIDHDTFSKENDALCDALAPIGLKRMYDLHMKWGKYPIYAITAEFERKWLYAAWVGLDDYQGTTLMFELVYPHEKPNQTDFALWNSFLDNTKPMPEPLYSQGFMVDIQPGCTHLQLYGAKFVLVAEQRFSDKMVQIIVDPAGSGFTFTPEKATYEFMLPGSAPGGPAAKIHGRFAKQDGSLTITQAIPILINTVHSFSQSAQEAKAKGKIVYEEKLPSLIKEYIGVN